MIKEKSMKLLVLMVCALLFNSSAALSDTIQTNVVTDDNGQKSEESYSDYYNPSTSSTPGSSSSSPSVPEIGPDINDKNPGQEEPSAEEVCGKDNENCSNLYNDRPLFPQAMMIYCQVSAKQIAEDLTLIEECIKKYVKAMNNDNAEIKHQGMQDYNVLRSQALRDTLTIATDKLKAIINYNDVQNDYANATAKSNTQRDTEAAIANSNAFATDMINTLREVYVENLKYMAIDGIASIDPAAILNKDEYEESKTTKRKSGTVTETENSGTSVETEITPDVGDESSGGEMGSE